MDANELREVVGRHQVLMDELNAVMLKHAPPVEEGAMVLAFLAGVATGMLSIPLTGDDPRVAHALAIGWQYANDHRHVFDGPMN